MIDDIRAASMTLTHRMETLEGIFDLVPWTEQIRHVRSDHSTKGFLGRPGEGAEAPQGKGEAAGRAGALGGQGEGTGGDPYPD